MLLKSILASAISLATFSAFAADYFVVVPLPNKTVNTSAIKVLLAQSSLPGATIGIAYSYNLNQNLQVTGDATYTGYGVTWSVVSGHPPSGLSLNASTGTLAGTPSIVAPGTDFVIAATYKGKRGQQVYNLTVSAPVSQAQLVAAVPAKSFTTNSGTQSFSVSWRNAGNGPMTLTANGISAPLSLLSNNCTSILPGNSCSMLIGVDTKNLITSGSALLSTAGATQNDSVPLSWTMLYSTARWGQPALDFGTVDAGTTATKTVALYNDGTGVANFSVTQGAPVYVSVNASACAAVAPGASCDVTLTYSPPAGSTTAMGAAVAVSNATSQTNTLSISGQGMVATYAQGPILLPKSTTVGTTLSATGAYTVSGWYKINTTGQTGNLISLGSYANFQNGTLGQATISVGGANNTLYYNYYYSLSATPGYIWSTLADTGQTVPANTWVHIAAQVDSNRVLRIAVNGTFLAFSRTLTTSEVNGLIGVYFPNDFISKMTGQAVDLRMYQGLPYNGTSFTPPARTAGL